MTEQAYAGLLPCPFCRKQGFLGGQGMGGPDMEHTWSFRFHCHGCGCDGPRAPTKDKAASAWNTRPEATEAISSLLERVGELEENITALWHESEAGRDDLHVYLGMTWEEYQAWANPATLKAPGNQSIKEAGK